jgi:hypothetical protein
MTSDSFVFNAGFIFFAAWTIVIAGVAVNAFASELLPAKTPVPGAPAGRAASTRTTRL